MRRDDYKLCGYEYDDISTPRSINSPLKIIDGPDGRVIDYYLIDNIENIRDYIDFLREVENAKSTDIIRIHINCHGGDGDIAWHIVDKLRESRAHKDIYIEGVCASAATLIMLAGNSWHIQPHSYVMIHAWHGWMMGKWNEQVAMFEYHKKIVEQQFRDHYSNFMTNEEIEACLQGKDFYFDYTETMTRLQNYQADLVRKQEAINKVQAKYQGLMEKEVQDIIDGKEVATEEKETLKEKILKKKESK